MTMTKVVAKEKKDLLVWSAHSTHDVSHLGVGLAPPWDRAALKDALMETQQLRFQYHSLPPILQMVDRIAELERQVALLRRTIVDDRSETAAYITAEKYPALVAAWDNDGDDVYNSL